MGEVGEIRVRDGVLGDLETIVRHNAALAKESEGLIPTEETLREGVRTLLLDPSKGRYFLAERNGSVVGQCAVTFEWSDWRNGTFLWFQSVYVHPEHRRQGIFRALYRHVEEIARRPGYCGLRLYVHQGNESAIEAYRRLGMVPGGYEVLETPDPLKETRISR